MTMRIHDRESDQLVAHHLSGPPEDMLVGFQVAAGLSYIVESEPTEPAPALVDSEPMQTEGEAAASEVSVRVSNPEPLFFESEPMCAGRRRKCRDMSGLSQCLCGDTAKLNEEGKEEGSIQCQKVRCETVWVSSRFHNQPVMFFDSLANYVHSITFSALGIKMH